MPKVSFVVEHREVEVKSGRVLSDIAADLGIEVCREEFAGTGFGDYTVWVKGDKGCVSPPTWYERVFKRCKGQRRMANRTKVLGDIQVWTQQGMGSRANRPRPLSPAPRAGEDGSELFDHENNAAGTAWNVYGHPHAVGTGEREAPVYVPKKKRVPKKKAAPAKAAPKADEAKAAPKADEANDE
jgi:hypothetical protein